MSEQMDWKSVIDQLRGQGYSITGMAERAGISRAAIYAVTSGRTKKSYTLMPLLKLLEPEKPLMNGEATARIKELELEVSVWKQAALALART